MCCAVASPTSETSPVPRKTTILCVDDSQHMLLICRTILEAGGFAVLTATDGHVALQMMACNAIDVAVIDNRMPGMNGVELARRLKAAYKNLPILMFSDSGPAPVVDDAIDLFLNKKNGPSAMRDGVKSLLKKNAAQAG